MQRSRLVQAFAVLVAWSLAGCGGADFSGGGARKKGGADLRRVDDEPLPSDPVPADLGPAVAWNFPCGVLPSEGSQALNPAIEGGGTFVAASDVPSYGINVTGELCEGALPPREVLFLFDSSTSMAFNDPKRNDSCNRLRALEAVAKAYEGKTKARFAIVTFSRDNSRLTLASAGFFPSAAELEASLVAQEGEDIGEIVCGSNHLGTNYDVAFGEAAEVVRQYADPGVETAIFFVSDGKPTFGHTGAESVATLKQAGVVINTIAVKGKETLMREQIASKDARGLPLHVDVASADDLADAMLKLNASVSAPGRFSYRAKGAAAWTDLVVTANAGDRKFQLAPFAFDRASYPDGLEVQYEYQSGGFVGKVLVPAELTWPAP